MYDQSKTPFITHVAPSTSANLTMTFNNQLNTVHSQVRPHSSACDAATDEIAFECCQMQVC